MQAVNAWEAVLGVPQTGTVAPGQIAVADGPVRVGLLALDVGSQLGTQANQTILTYSGTTRVVTVALDVDLQQYVKQGDTATLTLRALAAMVVTTPRRGRAPRAAQRQAQGDLPDPRRGLRLYVGFSTAAGGASRLAAAVL